MAGDLSAEQASAREEVMTCEKEIQSIKAALRRLGDAGNANDPNSLDIVLLKVEGLPETAKPILELQLSSPIEEGTLTQIFDPLNSDPPPEGSVVSFKGVETTTATLTVSAKDLDISLGSSIPQDLTPICTIDPMEVKDEYVTELPVAIVAEVSSGEALATAESTEEGKEDSTQAAATAEPIVPVCTVTLRITYKPSPQDQREELYEILNKASQRKATALENLRKISMTLARTGGDSPTKSTSTTLAKPSVKPGFLNKKPKEPTRLEKLYESTIGPNSILRKGLGIVVVTRNYFIFFGAITFFHFKGQLLSLPPPV